MTHGGYGGGSGLPAGGDPFGDAPFASDPFAVGSAAPTANGGSAGLTPQRPREETEHAGHPVGCSSLSCSPGPERSGPLRVVADPRNRRTRSRAGTGRHHIVVRVHHRRGRGVGGVVGWRQQRVTDVRLAEPDDTDQRVAMGTTAAMKPSASPPPKVDAAGLPAGLLSRANPRAEAPSHQADFLQVGLNWGPRRIISVNRGEVRT